MMAFWLGLPPWARTALMWTGAILLMIVTGKFIVAQHDKRIRGEERQKQEVETAKERERVIETSNKEISDVQDAKDAAIAAPHSLPEFGGADELREQAPGVARVILRDRHEDELGS